MGGVLLLVHSPLVGHATWDLVAAGLAELGYPVPTAPAAAIARPGS